MYSISYYSAHRYYHAAWIYVYNTLIGCVFFILFFFSQLSKNKHFTKMRSIFFDQTQFRVCIYKCGFSIKLREIRWIIYMWNFEKFLCTVEKKSYICVVSSSFLFKTYGEKKSSFNKMLLFFLEMNTKRNSWLFIQVAILISDFGFCLSHIKFNINYAI